MTEKTAIVSTVESADQDIQDVFADSGFCKNSGQPTGSFAKGTSVADLSRAWLRKHPITPPKSQDSKAYDKERNRRLSELLRLARWLETAGEIEVVEGNLNEGPRAERHKAVFKQYTVGMDD